MWKLIVAFVTAITALGGIHAQGGSPSPKRRITVDDAIGMNRLADDYYFGGRSSKGRVAQFSPDGRRFVVVTRKGNLKSNTNEFSLLLFQASEAFSLREPNLLLTMSSSSNRDAVQNVKWLADNRTVAFLGENPSEIPQVYTFNVDTRTLNKRTNSPAAVTNYGITRDGREVVFVAEFPKGTVKESEKGLREGCVIEGQSLTDLLTVNCSESSSDTKQLFLQKGPESAVPVPMMDGIYDWIGMPPSISPDGRYALIVGLVRDVPAIWTDYQRVWLRGEVAQNERSHGTSSLKRYLLLDTKDGSIEPFLNAPIGSFISPVWGRDGQSVFLNGTFLPLDVKDPSERQARETSTYDVEVQLPSKEFRKITKEEWARAGKADIDLNIDVSLEEDINTAPKIYAVAPKSHDKALLLDLNPQFAELDFGKVETVDWKASDGAEVEGGLYLPPDYTPGKRYPLVIQTHGFNSERFSMDGHNEWSSGFAARALAAKGIIVLQTLKWKAGEEISSGKYGGANQGQAIKLASASAYEGAVEYLDKRGMIDRNHVGLIGFSRTVCYVAYTLTHSSYHFAAASLVDGIDCGYFQYLAFPQAAWDYDFLNGGESPFGAGLKGWLRDSPSFNLEKVHTPVRLVALGPASVLTMWEWFSGLKLQNKPVDFVEIRDGVHLLQKPWGRRVAMQGIVDWFCFWLKEEEDPDPVKAEQYKRWRELRRMQEEGDRLRATGNTS